MSLKNRLFTIERLLITIFIFLLIPLLLSGCPYESGIPLSSPAKAMIDKELIGKWEYVNKEGHTEGIVTISMFNDHELLIVLKDEDKNDSEMLRAFVTFIGKEKILNIQEMKGAYEDRAWMFVNYSIANCTLSYRIVDDELIKKNQEKMSSSKEFYRFIKENLSNNSLYGNAEKTDLRCIKE